MRIAAAILALATAGATLTLSATPLVAEENSRLQVRTVDLDLSGSEDRVRLDRRIRAAARQICGPLDSHAVKELTRDRNCQVAARSSAWDQITATAASGQVRRAR